MASRFMEAIFPDGRMRTSSGFHSAHPLGRQGAHANQELGIFASVDVVGDGADTEPVPEAPAKAIDQSRLAAAHGTGDANSKGALRMRVRHKSKKENTFGPGEVRLRVRK